jgi:catechol 2,3-dioxygenase-like lactoylglutathione lyase family enzyme
MGPKSEGILESALYVSDVGRSVRFYEEVFGFSVIADFGERGCAMQAGERQVLLLFTKGNPRERSHSNQSPHDGDGELHIAFAIAAEELASWESWLNEKEIAVEEKRKWDLGGLEHLFSRSGSASGGGGNAGGLVGVLKDGGAEGRNRAGGWRVFYAAGCPDAAGGEYVAEFRIEIESGGGDWIADGDFRGGAAGALKCSGASGSCAAANF